MTDAQPAGARLILYVGKGGVGKTTLAATTAIRTAELGHRTLVVSTDLAHSLGDVLGTELASEPRELAPNLRAQEVNVLEEVRRSWGKVQARLSEFLRQEGMPEIQADELAILPGMEEVAALIQIERQGRTGEYDCVIVDAAPTGETIRLLSLPESFQWYAARVVEWRGRLKRIAGPLLSQVLPDLSVVDVMTQLAERVKRLRTALVNPKRSSYRIVLTPDRTVLREAQRAETYLNLFEYPVDALFVNRILSESKRSDPYLEALVSRQRRVLEDIERTFPSLPRFEVPLTADEPVGLEALSALARQTFGDRDPAEVMHVGASQSIQRDGDTYVLRIPMPNVEVRKLDLTKRGDELYVDVGNFRREVALPLALSTFQPGVARVHDGVLEVPFTAEDDEDHRPGHVVAAAGDERST
ncbi:MAG: ArsA family ATPase [Chloroflexi bacterium]|nr:ArsA family ATPase [Chloroflexota bacterium]MBV9543303.1 ArsA family ATPase [Chloroflexota bacterium]